MACAGASTRCAMRDVHVFGDLGNVWCVRMMESSVENSSFVNPYGVVVDDDDDELLIGARLRFIVLGVLLRKKLCKKLGLFLLTTYI